MKYTRIARTLVTYRVNYVEIITLRHKKATESYIEYNSLQM